MCGARHTGQVLQTAQGTQAQGCLLCFHALVAAAQPGYALEDAVAVLMQGEQQGFT